MTKKTLNELSDKLVNRYKRQADADKDMSLVRVGYHQAKAEDGEENTVQKHNIAVDKHINKIGRRRAGLEMVRQRSKRKMLKHIIGEHSIQFTGNSSDERRFVKKLIDDEMFKNMYSDSEYDPVFKGTNVRPIDRSKDRHGYNPGEDAAKYESVEYIFDQQLEEKLQVSDGAGKWIRDFQASDNPKFAGKSKEKRREMAIAAYMNKKTNEEVEKLDEISAQKKSDYALAALASTIVHGKTLTNRYIKPDEQAAALKALKKRERGRKLLQGKKTGVNESYQNDDRKKSYEEHHEEVIEHLQSALKHMKDHGVYMKMAAKSDKHHVDHNAFAMKEMKRRVEDLADDIKDRFVIKDPVSPKHVDKPTPTPTKHYVNGVKNNYY